MLNIAIHGHFYQPPREDPWLYYVLPDPSADPDHDWNERVYRECYKPNSSAPILDAAGRIVDNVNNYSHLSFDMGATLHRWIEHGYPELNRMIVDSGKKAIAMAYSHMIMPLASARDKETQIIWGMRDFEYRFGRKAAGMWLPETAVDTETLEALAAQGITFTILAPRQCAAVGENGVWKETPGGNRLDVTRPYLCRLPSGRSISIFFYHAGLAQDLAFGGLLDNGDRFRDALFAAVSDPQPDQLLLVATDGESYGHHHKFGDMALARCFQALANDPAAALPSLEQFLAEHPPKNECQIQERSSWSCEHGIERWRSDCACHAGGPDNWNRKWRAPLRQAFDNLRDRIDEIYESELSKYGDPWALRNDAIEVFMSGLNYTKGAMLEQSAKFAKARAKDLDEAEAGRLARLVEAQRMRQFMYISCAWFFNDISGIETKIALTHAVRAAQLTQFASGRNILSDFMSDLEAVKGNLKEQPTAAFIVKTEIFPHMRSPLTREWEGGTRHAAYAGKDEKERAEAAGKEKRESILFGKDHARALLSNMEHYTAFRSVAYFSMEIGLCNDIPTYSGGLGVLAGDILKSSADLGVPMVGITLLYKKGYFAQRINEDGRQTELPVEWDPRQHMEMLPNRVTLNINHRQVKVAAWIHMLRGASDYPLPLIFLDTDLPENEAADRGLTAELYGGDNKYRLCQELILGVGGLRMLRDLGFRNIETFHLNEGHAGFISLELLRELGYADIEKVREKVVFTTHTPVAAGHDFFTYDLIKETIESSFTKIIERTIGGTGLSMTSLALHCSRYVNGVSRKHAEISRDMFKKDDIDWVTNGVHSATWTSNAFAELYDRHVRGWRAAPAHLAQAMQIPDEEIWEAHSEQKLRLIRKIAEETSTELDPERLTVGFARRAASYKRADLIFSDIKRLLEIGQGKLQLVFSGKAHPHDEPGKDILQKICRMSGELGVNIPVVFLQNYNMDIAGLLIAGVDVWLNTPRRPYEASGTSGMKCVHNGVLNFSVLDGWWLEGCVEGVTGWAVGTEYGDEADDAADLYRKLEEKIIPKYYGDRKGWIQMMKHTIALNASYFNTHRAVCEYCEKAYGIVFRGH